MNLKDFGVIVLIAVAVVVFGINLYDNYFVTPDVPHNESGGVETCNINDPCFVSSDINIAAFNMQIFGQSKASNDTLLDRYADIFNDYTITFASEVRDESGEAVKKLCANPLLNNYTCFLSSRAGLSSSKESYLMVYSNANNIKLIDTWDYNLLIENNIEVQRPPLMALFSINGKDYRFFTMHTSPSTVPEDLALLENISAAYEPANAPSTVILGDFNIACSYYDKTKYDYFKSWNWLISGDTTTGASNCTYDQIFTNVGAYQSVVASGVRVEGVDSSLSDHYPVFVTLKA